MKDFNIAKYLKENYQGPFSMFQPYTDLSPLKEESEEQLDTEIPYKGPDPHLDGLGSEFDQVAPVEEEKDVEGGKVTDKELSSEMKNELKHNSDAFGVGDFDSEEMKSGAGFTQQEFDEVIDNSNTIGELIKNLDKNFGVQSKKVVLSILSNFLNQDATMRFDLSDPESSEDAYEWILDNISDDEDVVESEEEDYEFRQAPIEDIVDIINDRLKNATIEYDEDDEDDESITLTIKNTPQIKEAFSAEQEKYDRMMGLIDRTLETQLPKIKNAVDKARKRMISDKSIFNMLSTSSLTKQAVKDLVDDGFDPMDIVDFFATDFSIAEDGDNVTAADNAAYSADQEAGEPFEEEVTVSSSGVEMEGLDEDIDIWQMAGDHLEAFRSELANAHAVASQSGQKEWVSALNKIALRLDALEGAMAEASAKLGVLPTK